MTKCQLIIFHHLPKKHYGNFSVKWTEFTIQIFLSSFYLILCFKSKIGKKLIKSLWLENGWWGFGMGKFCYWFPLKIFLFKLWKFCFSNCQNFPFQTVKIFHFKLSKFSISNCQNFSFQTVKISHFKLSKFSMSNCQNLEWIKCAQIFKFCRPIWKHPQTEKSYKSNKVLLFSFSFWVSGKREKDMEDFPIKWKTFSCIFSVHLNSN